METTITVKGQLLDGVAYDDLVHVEFEIRPASVEDQLLALEDVAADSTDEDVDKGVHEARIRLAMVVRQIVSLGTIPREKISYAWLRHWLSPDDFDVLYQKSEEARKKRRALPKAGATF
ncbi:hypothetical protein OR16_31754 [Cupriavidus basilensis OR16]|uniref:Phage protein n=1 Tax=Cupriavidus basilensis OR16 TaxID=1127483 RepID=H1SDH4_9BURK|nr:hypothetical protein [Cupriavidus basilensis]EHP39428.1 hypothetical protein OR16_31754 [Cupriavidus basilensis OR16]